MEMTGEQRIEAPRARVWAALNDPEVLKACIPGCQSLEKTDDTHMKALAAVKVGPIGARFSGEVTLSEIDPPNGYRITGEGQGGAAGFAKGGALVRLADDGAATVLSYQVTAQVGGKISQLGGPLIDATAKQMASAFFKRLAEAVAPPPEPASAAAATPAPEAAPASSSTAIRPASPAGAAPGASPAALGLTAVCAGLAGFLVGRTDLGGAGAWSGAAVGLVVIGAAWAAYGFGRASARA